MKKVLITGGSGMIGTALGRALVEKGYRVIVLTRTIPAGKKEPGFEYASWDLKKKYIDEKAIREADFIVHLAGAGVAEKRWTRKRKEEIVSSRVESGKLIVNSLRSISNHVRAVISSSAIGWYGPDKKEQEPFNEADPPNDEFLGETCQQWENAIKPVTELDKRLVILRTGIVLSREGGALNEFLKPLKFGVAAVLGNGKQIISWIQIDDLINLYINAIENETMSGVYNAVASNPVSNKEFVYTLARIKRKFFIPVKAPSVILKIILGEMSIEVLKSCTVSNDKIRQAGFHFKFDNISLALEELTGFGRKIIPK